MICWAIILCDGCEHSGWCFTDIFHLRSFESGFSGKVKRFFYAFFIKYYKKNKNLIMKEMYTNNLKAH